MSICQLKKNVYFNLNFEKVSTVFFPPRPVGNKLKRYINVKLIKAELKTYIKFQISQTGIKWKEKEGNFKCYKTVALLLYTYVHM